MNLNDDEDMLEMGADGLWSERLGAGLLEHDRHDVVADVSLPQQLMKQNRDTEKCIKEAGRSRYGKVRGERAISHRNSLPLFLKNLQKKAFKNQLKTLLVFFNFLK